MTRITSAAGLRVAVPTEFRVRSFLVIVAALLLSSCGGPAASQTPPAATVIASLSPAPSATIAGSPTSVPTAQAPTVMPVVATLPPEPFLCHNNGSEVYLVFQGVRHHIVDWDAFLSLGFQASQIISCGASAADTESTPLTRWLKGSADPVYWMDSGQRHHIPDILTFQALGYRTQDIAVVPDALLLTWPEGAPVPEVPAASPTAPRPAPTPTSPAATAGTLLAALQAIHGQFQIDPSLGCYELRSPYPEYEKALRQITVLLLTDPRAQGLSLAERQALFAQVSGFDGVRFYTGDGAATLVALRTNRGHNLACGSHELSPDAVYVVAANGAISDIGTEGLAAQVQWVAGRWSLMIKLKLDATTGPTPWALWQAGPGGAGWQRVVDLRFDPLPYDFDPPGIQYSDGYKTLTATLSYWWATDPCLFNATFTSTYKHDTWTMARSYTLAGDAYQLTASQVLSFTVLSQATGQPVAHKWQADCTGPIQ